MVKLGYLYSCRGEWEGRRLISEKWIETEERCGFTFSQGPTPGVYHKWGMLGQILIYSPEKRWAAAWHSYSPDDRCAGLLPFTCEALEAK